MTTVSIEQGILKGYECYTDKGNKYFEFLYIPYAKPPVGNLRFKSPQPPEPWSGVRDITTVNENHVSCQMDITKRHYIGNEDCLYLNVYTPKLPTNAEKSGFLPVMLYIHSGGFLHGTGVIKSHHGPDYLLDNNVVVVSINYRLGILGFLSLDIPEAAGNMGLKDQIQALIWVQKNISKFGGDKNNVTVFGISAGAASIEYLILCPKSKGLFHKAILQSGSSLNHWAINFEPQIILHKLVRHIGFQGSTENHRAIYEYLMACSSTLLTEESFKVMRESVPERVFFGFIPTIERDFGNGEAVLTSNPYKLLKEGNFNKIPVIKGFCEMEGYMMSMIKPSSMEELKISENFVKHLAYSVETNHRDKYNKRFAKAYDTFLKDLHDENRNIVDFFSDYDFISGIWLSSHMMIHHGVDVYLYKFSYDGKINFLKNALDIRKKGAAHADDTAYIFKIDMSNLADEFDITVRDKLTNLWTNFAKNGNPGLCVPANEDIAPWPQFIPSTQEYLNIDKKFSVECFKDTTKMDIFKDMYDEYFIKEN